MQLFKIDEGYSKDLLDTMVIINNSINETFKSFYSDALLKDKIYFKNTVLKIDSQEFNLDRYQRIGICGIGKAVITTLNYLDTLLKPPMRPWAIIPEDSITDTKKIIRNIDFLPGSHPLPSKRTIQNTEEFLKRLAMFTSQDLLFIVISGGASSLFALPDKNLTIEEYRELSSILVYSGRPIEEINKYRTLIDSVKGGKVLNFIKSTIIGLYISDVVGDDIATIGSGPTVIPDAQKSLDITMFPKYNTLPKHLQQKLLRIEQQINYTNKNVYNILLIKQLSFGETLAKILQSNNQKVFFEPEAFYEDYQVVVQKIIETINAYKQETIKETFFLWTGESTVKMEKILLAKAAMGGRNQHLLLYLYKTWITKGLPEAMLMTLATDGKDGESSYAGGWLSTKEHFAYPDKIQQVLEKIDSFLTTFNSSRFLLPNNVFTVGSTGLNFADIILIYVF